MKRYGKTKKEAKNAKYFEGYIISKMLNQLILLQNSLSSKKIIHFASTKFILLLNSCQTITSTELVDHQPCIRFKLSNIYVKYYFIVIFHFVLGLSSLSFH
jgi:hypothetical protein